MRHPRLVGLVCLFAGTTTSASFLTLSNFEALASLSLPLNCVFAYNTPIRGCDVNDFMEESICSPRCRQGLQSVQINVMSSCTGISVMRDTLLLDAQQGRLVNVLCPGSAQGTTTITTTTTSLSKSAYPVPAASTSTAHSPVTTSSAAPTKPHSISSKSEKSTEPASSSSRTTFTTPAVGTPSGPVTTQSDSSTSQQSRIESTLSATNEEPPRRTLQPGSGGGSPFDFVTSGTSKSQAKSCFVGVVVAAVAVAFSASV
ncbi:hypothetical protein PT974_04998 [Cladobotryum mycophilum]|uniref:Uncharacterized protein n=1 Tax=Cladobotryum mycophilum TaxID=491253 RepID=A0ABR0SS19_9HYPO